MTTSPTTTVSLDDITIHETAYTRVIPADTRYISRILGTSGLVKAKTDTRGHFLNAGWYVRSSGNTSGAQVCAHVSNYHSTENNERAKSILADARAFLVAAGYFLDENNNVFKVAKSADDDYAFWNSAWKMYGSSHGCYVKVQVGDALVKASDIPAYKAERERREAEKKQAEKARQAKVKAEQARRMVLKKAVVKALEGRGMRPSYSTYSLEGATTLAVSFEDLATLLGVQV